jgi:hypothetical protein
VSVSERIGIWRRRRSLFALLPEKPVLTASPAQELPAPFQEAVDCSSHKLSVNAATRRPAVFCRIAICLARWASSSAGAASPLESANQIG